MTATARVRVVLCMNLCSISRPSLARSKCQASGKQIELLYDSKAATPNFQSARCARNGHKVGAMRTPPSASSRLQEHVNVHRSIGAKQATALSAPWQFAPSSANRSRRQTPRASSLQTPSRPMAHGASKAVWRKWFQQKPRPTSMRAAPAPACSGAGWFVR